VNSPARPNPDQTPAPADVATRADVYRRGVALVRAVLAGEVSAPTFPRPGADEGDELAPVITFRRREDRP